TLAAPASSPSAPRLLRCPMRWRSRSNLAREAPHRAGPWWSPGCHDRHADAPYCVMSRLRAQREALARQLLRDLPQTLGALWVESVRLDAVEGVGSVVHRGHVTVLEIETTAPLELRRGGGEHRGRGPGLDGLELHPAG